MKASRLTGVLFALTLVCCNKKVADPSNGDSQLESALSSSIIVDFDPWRGRRSSGCTLDYRVLAQDQKSNEIKEVAGRILGDGNLMVATKPGFDYAVVVLGIVEDWRFPVWFAEVDVSEGRFEFESFSSKATTMIFRDVPRGVDFVVAVDNSRHWDGVCVMNSEIVTDISGSAERNYPSGLGAGFSLLLPSRYKVFGVSLSRKNGVSINYTGRVELADPIEGGLIQEFLWGEVMHEGEGEDKQLIRKIYDYYELLREAGYVVPE